MPEAIARKAGRQTPLPRINLANSGAEANDFAGLALLFYELQAVEDHASRGGLDITLKGQGSEAGRHFKRRIGAPLKIPIAPFTVECFVTDRQWSLPVRAIRKNCSQKLITPTNQKGKVVSYEDRQEFCGQGEEC